MINPDLLTIEETLEEILAAITGSSSGEQQVDSDTLIGTGEIPAGKYSISINCSDDFVGTVNGIARAAGSTVFFQASPGKTLSAIPFEVSAGSFVLDTITDIAP